MAQTLGACPVPSAQLLAHWAKNTNFRQRTERKVKEPPRGFPPPVPVPRSILRSLVPNSSRNAMKRRREKRMCLVSRRPPVPARPLSLPAGPSASRAGGRAPGRPGSGGRRRGKFAPRLPLALTLRPARSRQLRVPSTNAEIAGGRGRAGDRARQDEGLPPPRPVPSAQGSPLRPGPALPRPLPVLTIVGESKAEFT